MQEVRIHGKQFELLILTSFISRLGGGLFDAVRISAGILSKNPDIIVNVLGLRDEFAKKDLKAWLPVIPQIFSYIGPSSFGYSPALKYQLEKTVPDLLHVHGLWMYQNLISSRLCFKRKVPYVISPHGMLDPWALSNSGWKKRIARILYENRNLHRANCLHALNQGETQAIRKYGFTNPISQIPNGVELPHSSESLSPPWKYALVQGKKILLFLGRIHPKKGLPALLTSWKHLRNSSLYIKDWSLVIVGWDQCDHEAELRKMCKDFCLEDSVHFMGPLFDEQKTAAYQNADAFILPSLSEGLPMTVLEAWANKLPVLMTPACNLPEGFEKHAAIAIQPNSEDITRGLNKLFSYGDNERILMGENGYVLVRSSFTWDKIAEDLHAVYLWILGGGSPPSCVITD